MTGFKVESQTALLLLSMAVLAGRRALLQVFRVPTADRDSVRRLAPASSCSRQYVLSGKVSISRLNGHGAATRHYSSESKDDLRVRYLDGEDAGKFLSESTPVQMASLFSDGKTTLTLSKRSLSKKRELTLKWCNQQSRCKPKRNSAHHLRR